MSLCSYTVHCSNSRFVDVVGMFHHLPSQLQALFWMDDLARVDPVGISCSLNALTLLQHPYTDS
jgi:hypothetical protein